MKISPKKSLLLSSVFLFHLMLASTVQAGIDVSLAGTSTSTQLDFVVTGTLEASDFGADFLTDAYPALFIYKPGLEWTGTGIVPSPQNYSDGLGLTAPSIELATNSFVVNSAKQTGTYQDLIGVEWRIGETSVAASDFNIGEVIDWQFSVRNFGIVAINFDLLKVSEIPFSAQLGTGVAVPEPSTYALLFGILGLGAVLIRRRKAS